MNNHAKDLHTVTTLAGDAAVVVVVGEVDANTCAVLTHAANEAVAGGGRRLILDFAGIEFIDSSGLAALISMHSHDAVTLRQPSRVVVRLLEVAGLTHVFAIEP